MKTERIRNTPKKIENHQPRPPTVEIRNDPPTVEIRNDPPTVENDPTEEISP